MSCTNAKTVLTVDDDPAIRQLIRVALEKEENIQVIEASDGISGLEAIRQYRPDLVLLDVVMPRQDGLHMLQTLRSDPDLSFIPVILLTGFKDREKLQPLLKQENTDFMAKPFILELLRQKVKDKLFPNSHVEAVAE